MKLIVCLDDKNGMAFGGRRQSRDSEVCKRILDISAGEKLWMNAYSAKLFAGSAVCVHEEFLQMAGERDFCFVENVAVLPVMASVTELVVFRWNRHYPSELQFPAMKDWRILRTEEFPGNSHDKISLEVYGR